MIVEMVALFSTDMWDMISLPSKFPISCRCVYAVKIGPDGRVDHIKAH